MTLVPRSAGDSLRVTVCSRWTELVDALKFHVGVARHGRAPSEFRLLNSSEPILIGDGADDAGYEKLLKLFNEPPNGTTPLCRHINEIIFRIREMEPDLRKTNQKVAVIIATDGESSDGDIAQAMRPLKDLPVWIVVRLCTDEDSVVDYWNNLDKELELNMDVLDDISGEAEEVFESNCWLTYGEPMHRIREFGVPFREFDMLDEKLLTLDQLKRFCVVL